MYKRLLDTDTVEAKQMYNKAKSEAKNAVRRAKNEEWVSWGKSWRRMLVVISKDSGLR